MSDSQSFIDPLRLGVTTDTDPDATLHLDQTWRLDTGGGITTLTVTERAGSSTNVSATSNASATATCNAGEISIGGGIGNTSTLRIYINESRRSGTTGWTITARNDAGTTQSFTPYVMCLATS